MKYRRMFLIPITLSLVLAGYSIAVALLNFTSIPLITQPSVDPYRIVQYTPITVNWTASVPSADYYQVKWQDLTNGGWKIYTTSSLQYTIPGSDVIAKNPPYETFYIIQIIAKKSNYNDAYSNTRRVYVFTALSPTPTPTNTPTPTLTPTPTPTVSASPSCLTPAYEPDYWNDNGIIQSENNCYNYACNKRTDTRARPGYASGYLITKPFSAQELITAAIRDGLDFYPKVVLPYIQPGKSLVALFMTFYGDDYHWYRRDRNGMWSHKEGIYPATNLDDSGKPITDPEKADRGKYTEFVGYFLVDSSCEQGQGKENIK